MDWPFLSYSQITVHFCHFFKNSKNWQFFGHNLKTVSSIKLDPLPYVLEFYCASLDVYQPPNFKIWVIMGTPNLLLHFCTGKNILFFLKLKKFLYKYTLTHTKKSGQSLFLLMVSHLLFCEKPGFKTIDIIKLRFGRKSAFFPLELPNLIQGEEPVRNKFNFRSGYKGSWHDCLSVLI